jgi:hypothetical protein
MFILTLKYFQYVLRSLARKPKELVPGEALHLSALVDPALAVRLDAVVTSLRESTGLSVSRTDVVRLLLKEALDARDARQKRKK